MPVIGLLPAQLDIEIYSGDIFVADIEFVDDTGAALNMDGYNWVAQVRTVQTEVGSPEQSFTVDASADVSGIISIKLLPTQTTSLLPAAVNGRTSAIYTWDLQRTAISDATDVRTTHAGTLTVYLDRTR